MGNLDPDDPRPPSEQVADAIRCAIRDRQLGPGAQLPSYSAMSREYGVAPNTVRSALAVLRTEGLIVSRKGTGSFVRTHPVEPTPAEQGEVAELREVVTTLTDRVDAMERRLAEVESVPRAASESSAR